MNAGGPGIEGGPVRPLGSRLTLRTRLLLVLAGLLVAGLTVTDIATYTWTRSLLYDQVDQELSTDTQGAIRVALGPQIGGPLQFSGAVWGECLLTNGAPCEGLRFRFGALAGPLLPPSLPGQLAGSSGGAALGAPGGQPGQPSSPQPAQTVFNAPSAGGEHFSYRVQATAIIVGGQAVGTMVLAVPLDQVSSTLLKLLGAEVIVSVLVVLGLGAAAWWIVRRGLRPLDEMAATALAIAGGDRSRRVLTADDHTEVGQLGLALNTMLARIEEAFAARAASEERLRRFLADAAHELRTPLTSIRGYAEIFDRGAKDRPEDLATAMRHIRSEADRMGLLVQDLLLLARLDQQRPLSMEPVDLASIVNGAVEAARVAAPDRQITTELEEAVVMGDAERLRQVADNLLTNAVKYTPFGSPVRVSVSVRPVVPYPGSPGVQTIACFEVADHGEGVPPAEREAIFEPFHRADPSRARSTGGVGLGLAIVAAIAKAHGGTVSVGDAEEGGALFVVTLPALAGDGTTALIDDQKGTKESDVVHRTENSQRDHATFEVSPITMHR